ncbi:MAG: glutamate mutase L, partial [bacterium]|nr:glutamate mutase L [bacterium]
MAAADGAMKVVGESAKSYEVLLATDCGSTTTKAILVERRGEGYRLVGRGEAPTTVEAPFDDVTVGVRNAVEELEEVSGRKLLEGGELICPRRGGAGVDAYFSTSSAGGGLQMAVVGVIGAISAQSAQRAALGAGAIVIDTIALDDPRADHERIERLRHMRPDMIVMAGGTNGGTRRHVEMLAELIRAARPQPRFGETFRLPVIYAGNAGAWSVVNELLSPVAALRHVANVRPTLETEELTEARHAIHELFLAHVMQQAPGYRRLMQMTSADIMPTPVAVGLIIQQVAATRGQNVLAVDIGGATTDVFSVFAGNFHRTVSANYGMSYNLCNVMAEAGVENILRWLPFEFSHAVLRDILRNKMIRPTTIPETLEELWIEQAAAREALRLSLAHHRVLAVDLRGRSRRREFGEAFAEEVGGVIDLMKLDLCIGSGGVLSHAPDRTQAALMMLDAFELEGFTQLAVDSIFMMPQLGVMSQLVPEAAREVFEKDCLVMLGTSIAAVGRARAGRVVMGVEVELPGGVRRRYELRGGELRRVDLGVGERARVVVRPARGFDVGLSLIHI